MGGSQSATCPPVFALAKRANFSVLNLLKGAREKDTPKIQNRSSQIHRSYPLVDGEPVTLHMIAKLDRSKQSYKIWIDTIRRYYTRASSEYEYKKKAQHERTSGKLLYIQETSFLKFNLIKVCFEPTNGVWSL